jgi:uncharacterized protein YbcI
MDEQQPSADKGHGATAAAISTQAVRVLREYTGRGPTKARTTINDDHVVIVMADTLTTGERTLVDAGRADRVLQVREDFQAAMKDDLIALVESKVDRKVAAFMSNNHIDPDLAVEFFVLERDPPETTAEAEPPS